MFLQYLPTEMMAVPRTGGRVPKFTYRGCRDLRQLSSPLQHIFKLPEWSRFFSETPASYPKQTEGFFAQADFPVPVFSSGIRTLLQPRQSRVRSCVSGCLTLTRQGLNTLQSVAYQFCELWIKSFLCSYVLNLVNIPSKPQSIWAN